MVSLQEEYENAKERIAELERRIDILCAGVKELKRENKLLKSQ